jgi:hypothetical protein
MSQLHPVFQQALAPYFTALRPTLTEREARLLNALQLMKGWVVQYAEPFASGTPMHTPLQRDLAIASVAILDATGGNEA